MAQLIDIQVSIEGEQISPISGVRISQDIHQHHDFEVALPMDAFEATGQGVMQQVKNYVGKSILIQLCPKEFKKNGADNKFIGLITKIGFSRSEVGEKQVLLQGYSPTILMDGKKQCRSYSEISLSALVDHALEKIPRSLESKVQPNRTATIPYVVQYHETNYTFLQRLAARYGEWCFYDGTKLVFGKLPKSKEIDLPMGADLASLDFSLQLMPVNGKAIAYNYQDNTAYEKMAQASAVSDLDSYGKFAMQQSSKIFSQEPIAATLYAIDKQNELDLLVETETASAARNMVIAKGCSDNPYLNVGSIVYIKGESVREQDYGKFIITSLVHDVDNTYSYQNVFTAIPAENQTPPALDFTAPIGNNQPAVVVDNQDPDNMGRVKVKFYWQNGSDSTPWIRIANTMAGGGKKVHGFYYIPEVDDEVMVGFEDNNPDKPFVLGSVYHKNTAPSEWYDSKNDIKAIRTRSGNQIYLIDKDGKEEIRILNKDFDKPVNMISLLMEGDGKITIETKGELVMKAKSIEMEAKEGIKITSGKATDVKAQEITMKAEQGIKMGSGQSTEIKADQAIKMTSAQATEVKAMDVKVNADAAIKMKGQQLDIQGTSAKIKADAQLSIEGAQSTIKAQMLQVDGGAQASVKAGIIRLN